MVGVVGIIIKINSFFFQKPPGYETVSATTSYDTDQISEEGGVCCIVLYCLLLSTIGSYSETLNYWYVMCDNLKS